MEKKIVKDIMFLRQKSTPAAKGDMQTAIDLIDTLRANADICVGLAANMIGIKKNIIIVQTSFAPVVMINPVIIAHSDESYEAEEGCLSLEGTRKTTRWNNIEVEYSDMKFKRQKRTYSGFSAQIIQHEIDHCKGIII
ncbi:MAG: peptide deformylase [Clostridia bacterium]|nr:peptide deformylase [Clostridia bacterium]